MVEIRKKLCKLIDCVIYMNQTTFKISVHDVLMELKFD
jgi:hypothetical protein